MATETFGDLETPSLTLGSVVREAAGLGALPGLALERRSLLSEPRGDGECVLVLHGFGADDRSTWILRRYLSQLGYRAKGWGLGRNGGDVEQTLEQVVDRIDALADRTEGRLSLVGWSLGGYLAREAARDRPERVRRVVTFGSPVIGGPKYTTAGSLAARFDWDLDEIERAVALRKETPLRVPVTAIYTRRDGVVNWRACIDDEDGGPIEHQEVDATHLGLGFSPDVYRIVARSLAQAGTSDNR